MIGASLIDPTTIILVVAVLTLVMPVVFLAVLGVAAVRRSHGATVGPRIAATLCILGGLTLGMFVVVGGSDLLVNLPILGAVALFVVREWRGGRLAQAGWILLGAALPWTVLWGYYVAFLLAHPGAFDGGSVWQAFVLGLVPMVAGAVMVAIGDPELPKPDPLAPAEAPGSRSFGSISAAIRAPGFIGPFGISQTAALVAFVIGLLGVPFLIPSGVPRLVIVVIVGFVASLLATEAYIRAMPRRARLAFETYSWLGEWELRRIGLPWFRVPTTKGAAEKWLARHPERPDRLDFQAELQVLAGRFADARATAERLPASTPWERFVRTDLLQSIDWWSGGEGDIEAMRAAAADLLPADGDERLRAEVSIASSQVRRRMADGRSVPGDAADPLIELRPMLGSRADGQVGRALRRRLFLTFLAVSVVLGVLIELVSPGGNVV